MPNQHFDSFLQTKLHQFKSWKNNHYVFLIIFLILFIATLWLENPLIKLPVLATSFFLAGKFVKEFESKKLPKSKT